jgi:hypothetical protein
MLGAIKQAAVEAVDASGPVTLVFGKVKSVDPFLVDVEQKLTLTETFITVGQYVKEYSLDLTIDGEMWHGFRVDDELIMARMQGGQKYVIMDFVKRVEEDTRPARVMQGEVVSIDELQIKVCDYLTLTADQLILCRNVREFPIDMTASHKTELETEHIHPVIDTYTGGGASRPTQHLHDYTGRKKFITHNGLLVGDTVLLICERVLQKWYVVDYINRAGAEIEGEWT